MATAGERARRIVVIGGGYSGAAFAVQLVRKSSVAVAITIVEPREEVGRGLAYSATDPDHRLNGPLESHMIDLSRPDELRQWSLAEGILDRDPDGEGPAGHVFLRRGDFGAFVGAAVSHAAAQGRHGSTIAHVRDTAMAVERRDAHYLVHTQRHGPLPAALVVLATGNPEPALRAPFPAAAHRHPAIIANPLQPGSLADVPNDARVLVVGSGLTALDIISTLLRDRPGCDITVVSRRGLRPSRQAPEILEPAPDANRPAAVTVPDADAPVPLFLMGEPANVLRWMRALRSEIERARHAGRSWHGPFDAVRDGASKLWRLLPLDEKLRFLRKLRIYYDVHRFRAPVMNDEAARKAEARNRVRFLAARITGVAAPSGSAQVAVDMIEAGSTVPTSKVYDLVVNCTGLDPGSMGRGNPVLASLIEQGMLRPHGTGIGFDVGPNCEAIDRDGALQKTLRVIGPPSAGAFGDPVAVVFIAAQIRRLLPELNATISGLDLHGRSSASRASQP